MRANFRAGAGKITDGGTPGGNRTPDAFLRTEALYPLSYGGRRRGAPDAWGYGSKDAAAVTNRAGRARCPPGASVSR